MRMGLVGARAMPGVTDHLVDEQADGGSGKPGRARTPIGAGAPRSIEEPEREGATPNSVTPQEANPESTASSSGCARSP